VARRALRVQDLKHPERFKQKLRDLLDCTTLSDTCGRSAIQVALQSRSTTRHEAGESLSPMLADVGYRCTRRIRQERQPAVRRRPGHAARHRPRHLSRTSPVQQLRGRQCGRREPASGRRCCTTCWASPRRTPRGWAAGRSRPNWTSTRQAA
jgi:hypothetical protein